jgi:hypothetical protein
MLSRNIQSRKDKALASIDRLDRRIALNLQGQIKQFLDYWEDAEIANARWTSDVLEISIRLPFWLPLPNEEAGDWGWLTTKHDLRVFRSKIKRHFLEEMRTEKLSNLLFSEYRNVVQRYVRAHRFGDSVVAKLPKTVERRLAGRPAIVVNQAQSASLRKQVAEIKTRLRDVKTMIPKWKKQCRRRKESSREKFLKMAIREHLPRDRFPWARFLFICFERLPARASFKGAVRDRRLSDPRSWSTASWAVRIVQEMHYRENGILPPVSRLQALTP